MIAAQVQKLRILARLWDRCVGDDPQEIFKFRFLQDLDRVNRLQLDFPDADPEPLLKSLEIKVILAFQRDFPEVPALEFA